MFGGECRLGRRVSAEVDRAPAAVSAINYDAVNYKMFAFSFSIDNTIIPSPKSAIHSYTLK